jgi:DNA-binding CsgD family transcriptional regulator
MNAKVSNPLTIVAIFAGLAEAFATVALVYLPHDVQQMFVYFVMAFPVLLVILFFAVLVWNHSVLYAPGDFQNESMYMELVRLRLKSKIGEALSAQGAGSPHLTPQQIESVSRQVERVIDATAVSPRAAVILDLLAQESSTAAQVAEKLGISVASAKANLKALAFAGRVRQGRDSTSKSTWSVVQRDETA